MTIREAINALEAIAAVEGDSLPVRSMDESGLFAEDINAPKVEYMCLDYYDDATLEIDSLWPQVMSMRCDPWRENDPPEAKGERFVLI